jgi:hypothetical protein
MRSKVIALAISLGVFSIISAQEFAPRFINLIGGKQFTNFVFKNSQNQKDQSLEYQMYNAFGVNAEFTNDKHTIRPEIQIRQAGAKTSVVSTPIVWKMNYFNFNIGYLYSILQSEKFEIQPGLAIGAGYMLNGEQTIGDTRLSIIEEESMNRFEFGLQGISNFKAHLTDKFSISLEYRFGIGINHIENDLNEQKSRNIYHGALLGLGFRLN